jgi:hypothetical protein
VQSLSGHLLSRGTLLSEVCYKDESNTKMNPPGWRAIWRERLRGDREAVGPELVVRVFQWNLAAKQGLLVDDSVPISQNVMSDFPILVSVIHESSSHFNLALPLNVLIFSKRQMLLARMMRFNNTTMRMLRLVIASISWMRVWMRLEIYVTILLHIKSTIFLKT